ncbi:MAG TPA: hypothetical protein EYP32_07630 [Aquificaceae bacterium]|nr:hypothetical protein [Aquificaceae bacterium]HIQ48059.1 hypothetical protein [Aquifex aeolicus]
MNRRIFLLPFLYILSLPRALAKEDNTIRIIFPVTFKDKKRMKKVFMRIRGAINLWGTGVDIEVIAYDEGIAFLDRFESGEFEERISNLMLYGVKFKACSVAMKMFGVSKEDLFEGVEVVRSGFEYHVLKVKEGYIPIYL